MALFLLFISLFRSPTLAIPSQDVTTSPHSLHTLACCSAKYVPLCCYSFLCRCPRHVDTSYGCPLEAWYRKRHLLLGRGKRVFMCRISDGLCRSLIFPCLSFRQQLGACGWNSVDSDYVVALPTSDYDGGSNCGKVRCGCRYLMITPYRPEFTLDIVMYEYSTLLSKQTTSKPTLSSSTSAPAARKAPSVRCFSTLPSEEQGSYWLAISFL